MTLSENDINIAVLLSQLEEEKFARQLLDHILDNLPTDIAVFSTDFRYIYVNKKAIPNDELREWIIGKTDVEYSQHTGNFNTATEQRMMHLQQTLATGETVEYKELVENNGQLFLHIRILTPIIDRGIVKYILAYGLNLRNNKI